VPCVYLTVEILDLREVVLLLEIEKRTVFFYLLLVYAHFDRLDLLAVVEVEVDQLVGGHRADVLPALVGHDNTQQSEQHPEGQCYLYCGIEDTGQPVDADVEIESSNEDLEQEEAESEFVFPVEDEVWTQFDPCIRVYVELVAADLAGTGTDEVEGVQPDQVGVAVVLEVFAHQEWVKVVLLALTHDQPLDQAGGVDLVE